MVKVKLFLGESSESERIDNVQSIESPQNSGNYFPSQLISSLVITFIYDYTFGLLISEKHRDKGIQATLKRSHKRACGK